MPISQSGNRHHLSPLVSIICLNRTVVNDPSGPYFFSFCLSTSSSCSMRRITFPTMDLGKLVLNSTCLGTLYAVSRSLQKACISCGVHAIYYSDNVQQRDNRIWFPSMVHTFIVVV